MNIEASSSLHMLRHVSRAFLAQLGKTPPPIGSRGSAWCAFMERCSRQMSPELSSVVGPLLYEFSEREQGLGSDDRRFGGLAARRVLSFAWGQEPRNRWTVINSLIAVCRSFDTDPTESAALLRRSLERKHLERHGHEEMPRLAGEIHRLVPIDPAFVSEVYRAVLGFEDPSDDATRIGSSNILAMSSNRRQDYRIAYFRLVTEYEKFMAQAPVEATASLIAGLEGYIARTSVIEPEEIREEMIEVNGRTARLASDCSGMWDVSRGRSEPLPAMLDHFEKRLRELCDDPDGVPVRERILERLITENRYAAPWRRVLACAARAPTTLGQEVRSLAWSMPVLTGFDFEEVVGRFLAAVFPTLSREERENVENAIMSIAERAGEEDRANAEHDRDRLLCRLPAAELLTEGAQRRAAELATAPHAEPAAPTEFEAFGMDFSEVGMLAQEGVEVDDPPNRRLQEVAAPVKTFAGGHLNSAPTTEDIKVVLPALRTLREAIARADAEGVHPAQKDAAWCDLAAACACLTRSHSFACDDLAGALVRDVLLEAASHPLPRPPEPQEHGFVEDVAWKHTPRSDAAEGLCRMGAVASCRRADVLAAVERLASDPVALVRLQVAENLFYLGASAADLMWRILESLARDERNLRVLLKAMTQARELADTDHAKLAPIVHEVFRRIRTVPEADWVRNACLALCLRMGSRQGNPFDGDVLVQVLADVVLHAQQVDYLVKATAHGLVFGPIEPANPRADGRRRQTLRLFERIAADAADAYRALRERYPDGVPDEEGKTVEGIVKVSETLSQWVYFTSGADDKTEPGDNPERGPLDPAVKLRFLRETGDLLGLIASVPHPEVIHHLLQMLEAYVPVDPREVFLRVGQVVRAGREGGYQFESMGADLIVRLVQRYLAEYGPLFRDHPDCVRTLMDLLDTFIRAGWPSAFRLTYGLEDLFR